MIVGGIDGNNDGSHVGQTLRQRLLGALADVLEALVRGRLPAGVVVALIIREVPQRLRVKVIQSVIICRL